MKLRYTTLALAFAAFGSTAFAQTNGSAIRKADERSVPFQVGKSKPSTKQPSFTSKAVILSQDFEGTTFPPQDWTKESGSTSTVTAANQEWHRRANGGYPQNTDAFNGTTPGGCAAVLYVNSVDQHDEYLITPEVTLPAGENFQIAFDFASSVYWHVTNFDNADITVHASTDGGQTWSAPLWQEDDDALLEASYSDAWLDGGAYNWFRAFVNVSDYAGQDVMFAFHYVGLDGAPFYLDNVVIENIPDNDLGITAAWPGDIMNAFDYSRVPTSQVQPAVVGVAVRNTGLLAQSNKTATVEIKLGNTSVYTGATAPFTLAPGEVDTFWVATNYTPSTVGNYTVEFALPADDNVENDETNVTFQTTLNTYSHDYVLGGDNPGSGIYRLDEDAPVAIGTRYQIFANDDLYGIDLLIEEGTDEGIELELIVYEELSSVQDLTPVASTNYVVPASAIANGITTVKFSSAVPLSAGKTYIIQALVDQSGQERLFIAGSDYGDSDNGTVNYGPFGTNEAVNHFIGWGFSPAIRMNFDQSLNVNEVEKGTEFAIYPNPAKDQAKVSFNLAAETAIEMNVTDLAGKVVLSENLGNKTAGNHVVKVNTSSLNEGIYMVNFVTNGVVTTQKLVIR